MKGYWLFQDIETWHFSNGLPWQTLTKFVQRFRNKNKAPGLRLWWSIHAKMQEKKISAEDAQLANEDKTGERLRNEAWAPTPGCLCVQHQVMSQHPYLHLREEDKAGFIAWVCPGSKGMPLCTTSNKWRASKSLGWCHFLHRVSQPWPFSWDFSYLPAGMQLASPILAGTSQLREQLIFLSS